jgi:hypothetical protein
MLQDPFRNSDHLVRRLAFGENHLGHAVSERSVVIDLGVPQILERHVAEPLDRAVGIDIAAAHLFEKRAELVLVHKSSIAGRRKTNGIVPLRAPYRPKGMGVRLTKVPSNSSKTLNLKTYCSYASNRPIL